MRYYGQWMRDEADKRIGHLYPKVEVTAEMVKVRPDLKPYAGRKLTVIAWLWARAVKSPNPAFAKVDVPLASTFMLRILDRDELDRLGSDPDAPFALAAAPGFVLDRRADPPDLQPNPGMSHGHHPENRDMDTGLVAAGAGMRAGASTPLLHLTNLAPLVAALLGVDFDAPDGSAYPGLLVD